jgi:hypothetical protein
MVGATAREAARLKGRLTGGNKKRRLDVDNAIVPNPEKGDDDDEEDSRGRSIKKKLRVDPFAMKSSKSRKKQGSPGGDNAPPVLRANEKTSKVEGTKDLVALGSGTSGQSPPASSSPPSKAEPLQSGVKEPLPKEDAAGSCFCSAHNPRFNHLFTNIQLRDFLRLSHLQKRSLSAVYRRLPQHRQNKAKHQKAFCLLTTLRLRLRQSSTYRARHLSLVQRMWLLSQRKSADGERRRRVRLSLQLMRKKAMRRSKDNVVHDLICFSTLKRYHLEFL